MPESAENVGIGVIKKNPLELEIIKDRPTVCTLKKIMTGKCKNSTF